MTVVVFFLEQWCMYWMHAWIVTLIALWWGSGGLCLWFSGYTQTHTHTHTHTHTPHTHARTHARRHVATYEYKCLWHSNMYMQHLQNPQQSGTAGHTEIEAADSYTQTDKPVPSMLWARHLWRRFQKEIPRAKLVHFTDSSRTLAYVVDRAHLVLGRSCGFSVATCQGLWYGSHLRRRWDQGGKRWLASWQNIT